MARFESLLIVFAVRMIDITKEMAEGSDDSSEVAKTRVAVLSAYL